VYSNYKVGICGNDPKSGSRDKEVIMENAWYDSSARICYNPVERDKFTEQNATVIRLILLDDAHTELAKSKTSGTIRILNYNYS